MKQETGGTRRVALISLLLFLLALASVTAVTVAWFSISDNTRLYSMDMDVTAGPSLRFDLDAHREFTDYRETLSAGEIYARIRQEQGYDPAQTVLRPVTSEDGQTFTLRSGEELAPDSGAYLQFTLHFMATEGMIVHLSSANSGGQQDGTLVSSGLAQLPEAMRISFTYGQKTVIFDPGATDSYQIGKNILVFGLPQAESMIYNSENGLFHIDPETDASVDVRIWMEGTDPACNDELQDGDFSIRLRFVGTDAEHNLI